MVVRDRQTLLHPWNHLAIGSQHLNVRWAPREVVGESKHSHVKPTFEFSTQPEDNEVPLENVLGVGRRYEIVLGDKSLWMTVNLGVEVFTKSFVFFLES